MPPDGKVRLPPWVRDDDPWIKTRMHADRRITEIEEDVMPAVSQAMALYLRDARLAILGAAPKPTVTAARGDPLDLSDWPPGWVWGGYVSRIVVPTLLQHWGEAFLAAARASGLSAQRWREAFIQQVEDRLSPDKWPAGVFEEVRYEIAQSISEGFSTEGTAQRIADVLHINAWSRRVRADAARLRRLRDHPDTSGPGRERARRELRELYAQLGPADRQWQGDARRIARTETMSALNNGTYASNAAWQEESGEPQVKTWLATSDGRTRDSHREADSQQQPLMEPFDVGGALLMYPGDPSGPPEAVIQCFPEGTLVQHSGISAVTRRWFDGELIKVSLASGNSFSCTPNHPILRSDGRWVAAGELDKGHDLVHAFAGGEDFGAPDEYGPPVEISQVYEATQMSSLPQRISLTPPDFHGDGRYGEVDVVPVDGVLPYDFQPTFDEPVREVGFALANQASLLAFVDGGSQRSEGPIASPATQKLRGIEESPFCVGGGSQPSTFNLGQATHSQNVGFASAASTNASTTQSMVDESPADLVFLSESFNAHPRMEVRNDGISGDFFTSNRLRGATRPQSNAVAKQCVSDDSGIDSQLSADSGCPDTLQVALDHVVDVKRVSFTGHVYNLHTKQGWYIANYTPVRNCRCTLTVLPADLAAAATRGETAVTTIQEETEPEPVFDTEPGGPSHTPPETPEQAAEPEPEDHEPVTAASELPTRWRAMLAPLDTETGDGRVISAPEGPARVRPLPIPLLYQEYTGDAHNGSYVIGAIDDVWVEDNQLWGEGRFDTEDERSRGMVARIAGGWQLWVSPRLDETTVETRILDSDGNEISLEQAAMLVGQGHQVRPLDVVTDWQVMNADVVSEPAFKHSRMLELSYPILSDADAEGLVAAATGSTDLPFAPRDKEWNGSAAAAAIAKWASSDGSGDKDTIDWGQYGRGFLYRDTAGQDGGPDFEDFKLPFATVVDGQLKAVYRGVSAAAAALRGARGGVSGLSKKERSAIRSKLSTLYTKARKDFDDDTIRAPWDTREDTKAAAVITAAAGTMPWAEQVAAQVPLEPDPSVFTNPQLSRPTKVHIVAADDGVTYRVVGHVAPWNVEHMALPGRTAPPNRSYHLFHRHPVLCTDGGRVYTGPLAMGGHASTHESVRMSDAMAHYDDPSFVAADVVAGEDAHGIWVSGALRPGVAPLQVVMFDRYSFSGDWRNHELIAACSVSSPGFPIVDEPVAASASVARLAEPVTRARVGDDGHVYALVAAGIMPTRPGRGVSPVDPAFLAAQVAPHLVRELSAQGSQDAVCPSCVPTPPAPGAGGPVEVEPEGGEGESEEAARAAVATASMKARFARERVKAAFMGAGVERKAS